jgi:3-hydroxyisobutyrate dehydrogenase
MRIGFIGLGKMGAPMAKNLADAGHNVLGFDIAKVLIKGVSIVKNIKSVAENMDVIITMLPNGELLQEVYAQIIPIAKENSVLIDCSTVDIKSALNASSLAKANNIWSMDAPVSGGVVGAESGMLTFMVGGNTKAFETVTPLFEVMGQKAVLCGDNGSGQAAKICNNMILGISMIAVCEGFALADQLKLDRQKMFDVASTSSGQCWSLNTYCPVPGVGPKSPSDNGYEPGFSTDLMLKDLSLAQSAAKSGNVHTPLGEHAQKIFADFYNKNGQGKDFSAVINFLKEINVKPGK